MKEKVTINERGALTIPFGLRRAFGIKAKDELILEATDEGILLRPAFRLPVEFYTEKRIAEFSSEEAALGKKLSRH